MARADWRRPQSLRAHAPVIEHRTHRMIQITLIHGTWARGLPTFARMRTAHRAKWAREGSSFRSSLNWQLDQQGIPHAMDTFEWSGANSFLERDDAARDLAQRLAGSRPDQRHVIIAHSHGGNVALRASQIMLDRGWPKPPLSIITVATPFIHIRHEIEKRWLKFLGAYLSVCLAALWLHLRAFDAMGVPWMPLTTGVLFLKFLLGGSLVFLLIFHIVAERISDWSERLANAGYYGPADELADLLVLRGTEDEASMGLALGLIGVRLSDIGGLLTTLTFALVFILFIALVASSTALAYFGVEGIESSLGFFAGRNFSVRDVFDLASSIGFAMAVAMILPGLFKCAFGRELLIGTAALSVTANSAPDVASTATIVTLNRGGQGESPLLHSLYDHPYCALEIAKWLAAGREVG